MFLYLKYKYIIIIYTVFNYNYSKRFKQTYEFKKNKYNFFVVTFIVLKFIKYF